MALTDAAPVTGDGMAARASAAEVAAGGASAAEAEPARSAFDILREAVAGHIGAVRRVEAGQSSAEDLVSAAEDELADLKRVLAANMLAQAGGKG